MRNDSTFYTLAKFRKLFTLTVTHHVSGPVNLLLQRSKRQKPFCTHSDKLKLFVADEMPKSRLTTAVQDDRAGQLLPEERVFPDSEGTRTLKCRRQRAVDEDVSTAIAGVPLPVAATTTRGWTTTTLS